MPPEPIPKDPVYMSYITRHPQEVIPPTPQRTSSPFRPYSGLTHTDQQLQGSRSIYPHFHRPFNDHSRYLATASGANRAVYRDLPRRPPPPWDGTDPAALDDAEYNGGTGPRRPLSAPPPSRPDSFASTMPTTPTLRLDLRGITLTDNMVTATGVPCYTVTALVEADLDSGTPVPDPPPEEEERTGTVAVVQTYPVPPSILGYGEGGVRPFHQDYRHYKYYGFAGKGAKTSWAHNPKYGRLYGEMLSTGRRDSTAPPLAFQDVPVAEPLQDTVGGPRRPLTAVERRLVKQFGWHNYGSEGVPSDPKVTRLLAHVASGLNPTPRTLRHLKLPQQRQPTLQQEKVRQQYSSLLEGEIIEPYRAKVNLESRRSQPADAAKKTRSHGSVTDDAATKARAPGSDTDRSARVTTYRQMTSPYAGEINRSPNHGSQSPWHQRYNHYKYSGFAGKGATSSWARNPKYAYMYD